MGLALFALLDRLLSGPPTGRWVVLAFLPGFGGGPYYLAVAQSNDIIRYRWLFHHLRRGTSRNALALLPLWVPSFALAAGLAIVVAVLTQGEVRTLTAHEAVPRMLIGETWSGGVATAIALILFMLRDLGIVLLLNFGKRPKAPDLAAVFI